MTTDPVTPTAPAPGVPAPFGRLQQELAELGFDPADPDPDSPGPEARRFTATDSPLMMVLSTFGGRSQAVLSTGDWAITLSPGVPDPVQLMVLYAALHPDNPAQACRAALAPDQPEPSR